MGWALEEEGIEGADWTGKLVVGKVDDVATVEAWAGGHGGALNFSIGNIASAVAGGGGHGNEVNWSLGKVVAVVGDRGVDRVEGVCVIGNKFGALVGVGRVVGGKWVAGIGPKIDVVLGLQLRVGMGPRMDEEWQTEESHREGVKEEWDDSGVEDEEEDCVAC